MTLSDEGVIIAGASLTWTKSHIEKLPQLKNVQSGTAKLIRLAVQGLSRPKETVKNASL